MAKSDAIKFRSPYFGKGFRVVSAPHGASRTKQEFLKDCDINSIMRKYRITGQLPVGRPMPGVGSYGDFVGVGDFHAAQEAILRAQDQFASLPAAVRRRFGDDPAKFLGFVADERNLEEAHDLGLLGEEGVKRVVARRAARQAPPSPEPKA